MVDRNGEQNQKSIGVNNSAACGNEFRTRLESTIHAICNDLWWAWHVTKPNEGGADRKASASTEAPRVPEQEPQCVYCGHHRDSHGRDSGRCFFMRDCACASFKAEPRSDGDDTDHAALTLEPVNRISLRIRDGFTAGELEEMAEYLTGPYRNTLRCAAFAARLRALAEKAGGR